MSFVKCIPIRLDDVDYARVLYYPRQVHFLVVALEDFFETALGLPWPAMFTSDNLAMPTVDLQVTYRRPLRFGDVAEITLTVRELGNRKAVFAYQVLKRGTEEVTCHATQTVVFVNNKTWETVRVPQPYRDALAEHLESGSE